jgi:hypothetical protein
MATLQRTPFGALIRFDLDGRELRNGDRLMVKLRGNDGWQEVEVAGLPKRLQVRWQGNDGKSLITTLPDDTEVEWPAP